MKLNGLLGGSRPDPKAMERAMKLMSILQGAKSEAEAQKLTIEFLEGEGLELPPELIEIKKSWK